MRVLLACPETPDTFWSFKHVVRLVSRKAAFQALGRVFTERFRRRPAHAAGDTMGM